MPAFLSRARSLAKLWSTGPLFRQSFIVFLDYPLVLRQELLAERSLHLVTELVGQMAPDAAEQVFHIGGLNRLFRALLDPVGAVARRRGNGIAAAGAGLI